MKKDISCVTVRNPSHKYGIWSKFRTNFEQRIHSGRLSPCTVYTILGKRRPKESFPDAAGTRICEYKTELSSVLVQVPKKIFFSKL